MKQNAYLTILITALFLMLSCSSEDSETDNQGDYLVTFAGSAFVDNCDITTNSYDIKLEFLSDNQVRNTKNYSGSSNVVKIDDYSLSGDIIGLRVTLNNFDINNQQSGRGTGMSNINVTIEDEEFTNIFEGNIGGLLICTDTWYEVMFTYNVSTDTPNIETKTHDF